MKNRAPAAGRAVAVVGSVAGLVLTGATASAQPGQPGQPAGYDDPPAPVAVSALFAGADSGGTALTYDPDLVPEHANVAVRSTPLGTHETLTTLEVRGLEANRAYGAHVHVNSCGPTGDHAGAHFQHVVDPVQPSTDPAYANPENEIWLDFTTNEHGIGFARSTVPWRFDERRAGAVVIHEHHTHTGPGEAGAAGDRLGCVSVDF